MAGLATLATSATLATLATAPAPETGPNATGVPNPSDRSPRPGFRAVYDGHFTHIWHTLRRLGIAERDLEDATHEVFVVVHRQLDSHYDPSRPLRPWLSGIAYRVASDDRRRARNRREQVGRLPEPVDARPSADQLLVEAERRRLVLEALDTLDLKRRAIFVMHELDGFVMSEIAEALGVSINTCYSRLRVARKQFAGAVRRIQVQRGER